MPSLNVASSVISAIVANWLPSLTRETGRFLAVGLPEGDDSKILKKVKYLIKTYYK